jgi:UDP-N-acetyl-D-galactosamine dehydrogenase
MTENEMPDRRSVAVVGLGHVGLTIAIAFARAGLHVIGFDIDSERIAELRRGYDRLSDVDAFQLDCPALDLVSDPAALVDADFYLIAAPTRVDDSGHPDLGELLGASTLVGPTLRFGDIVVYVSTVYPGAIEDACIPALERSSRLSSKRDFAVGCSPERADLGDKVHQLQSVKRVVAGQDQNTCNAIADVFDLIVTAGIHKAPSIRVAETAKLAENAQRHINIALINELSLICSTAGIDTADVIEAASTKWNFMTFTPGLVGGECLELATFYLEHTSRADAYRSEMMSAARRANNAVPGHIATTCDRLMRERGIQTALITVLGMTYKEDVHDVRNSKVLDLIAELRSRHPNIQVHDPLVDPKAAREYGIDLVERAMLKPADAVILAVPHREFLSQGWSLLLDLLKERSGTVIDIKSRLDRSSLPPGIDLYRL